MEVNWESLSATCRIEESLGSARREALFNTLIAFFIAMNMVRLIEICLSIMFSVDRISKHLSGTFPTKNRLNKGGSSLSNFTL